MAEHTNSIKSNIIPETNVVFADKKNKKKLAGSGSNVK
jgi:hypothetical protein